MKNLIVITAILTTQFIFSQDAWNLEKSQFKINILTPGVEWEKSIGLNSTIDFQLGTGYFFRKQGDNKLEAGVFPFLDTQYRYYYNFKRRSSLGKRIDRNSANYFAFSALVQSGKSIIGNIDFNEHYGAFVGPLWGMQRTYGGGFNLNLHLGLGYAWSDLDNGDIVPNIGFTLGWVLGGSKN